MKASTKLWIVLLFLFSVLAVVFLGTYFDVTICYSLVSSCMISFIFCYCCYYNITWVLYNTTLTYLKMVLDYIKSKCRKLLFFLSNCSNSPNLRIETQHGIVIEQVASKPGEVLKRTEKNLQCLFQSAKIDTLLEGYIENHCS